MKNVQRDGFKVKKIYEFGSRIAHNRFTWRFPRLRAFRRLVDNLAQKIFESSAQWIMVVVEKKQNLACCDVENPIQSYVQRSNHRKTKGL